MLAEEKVSRSHTPSIPPVTLVDAIRPSGQFLSFFAALPHLSPRFLIVLPPFSLVHAGRRLTITVQLRSEDGPGKREIAPRTGHFSAAISLRSPRSFSPSSARPPFPTADDPREAAHWTSRHVVERRAGTLGSAQPENHHASSSILPRFSVQRTSSATADESSNLSSGPF